MLVSCAWFSEASTFRCHACGLNLWLCPRSFFFFLPLFFCFLSHDSFLFLASTLFLFRVAKTLASQQGMDVSFTGVLSHVEGMVKGGMESGKYTAADLCFSLQVKINTQSNGRGKHEAAFMPRSTAVRTCSVVVFPASASLPRGSQLLGRCFFISLRAWDEISEVFAVVYAGL